MIVADGASHCLTLKDWSLMTTEIPKPPVKLGTRKARNPVIGKGLNPYKGRSGRKKGTVEILLRNCDEETAYWRKKMKQYILRCKALYKETDDKAIKVKLLQCELEAYIELGKSCGFYTPKSMQTVNDQKINTNIGDAIKALDNQKALLTQTQDEGMAIAE